MSNSVSKNLHPSLKVIDSTKIKSFQTCPRKFFFEHVLGWSPDQPSHDLWYGQAVHYALEHMYGKWKERGKPGYTERDAVEGFQKFLDHYRQKFAPDTDAGMGAKSPENTMRMLLEYIDTYQRDSFEVVYTEISGSVVIGESVDGNIKRIFFRLDTVCLGEYGYFILEHKTSKWNQHLWRASWTFATQVGTGNHLLWSLFGDEKEGVDCLRLNGIFLQAPLKTKDRNAAEFLRVPRKMSGAKMQDWLVHVNYDWDSIHQQIAALDKCGEGDEIMHAFPRNPDGCVQYNRVCPFMDYCEAYLNPLKNTAPPIGFQTKHWDPRDLDSSYTKKVEIK